MFRNSPISAWRNQKNRYQLQGVRCAACTTLWYPRKYLCSCGSAEFSPYLFKGKATLISYTQINVTSIEFIQTAPHIVGLLQLEEGPRLLAQLADVELQEIAIGMRMVAAFRRYFTAGPEGMIFYGIKFIPEQFG